VKEKIQSEAEPDLRSLASQGVTVRLAQNESGAARSLARLVCKHSHVLNQFWL